MQKMITKKELLQLDDASRREALQDLENQLNAALSKYPNLKEYQEALYSKIDDLSNSGFDIGRWDYNCEQEVWGGPSYMDESKDDELILKSWFAKGIKVSWNYYDFWDEFDEA